MAEAFLDQLALLGDRGTLKIALSAGAVTLPVLVPAVGVCPVHVPGTTGAAFHQGAGQASRQKQLLSSLNFPVIELPLRNISIFNKQIFKGKNG